MRHYLRTHNTLRHLFTLALTASLALPLSSLAASVSLATSPLATSTTSTVLPNVMFILDNSGSMDWDHMPDNANAFNGDYGYASSQCNQVYYDPNTTYLPPVDAAGVAYADASFSSARTNGYSTAACTSSTCTNLNTSFSPSGSYTAGSAFYYAYTGSQLSDLQKDYNTTTSTFYTECNSAINATPGSTVFSKRRLATTETTTIIISGSSATTVSSITVNGVELMSATSTSGGTSTTTTATNVAARITLNGYSATASGSTVTITGPTSAANYKPVITQSGTMTLTADVFPDTTTAKLTNFANWYSFYRSRLLMMKTAAGRAFKTLDSHYRVGFMSINTNSDFLNLAPFDSTQKSLWYAKLYNDVTNGSTPLREALANAGRLYAGKLTLTGVTVNDPVQYSCQQDFTILSTDGFWNGNAGYQVDGSTAVANQDGTAARPQYDGASGATMVTTTYTRNSYSQGSASASGCSSGKHKLKTQPQIFSCSITTVNGVAGSETCTTPTSNGSATYSGLCVSSVTLPSPNPSTRVQSGTPVTSTTTVGGTSDTLADVAMYYYQTDLRTSALNNCTGAMGAGVDVCPNDVFKTDMDNNTAQHMSTFTLGLGASGMMRYSSSYLTDTSGDYYSVWKGITARPAATNMLISVNGTSSTSVSSIKINGVELMSGATTADTSSSALATKIAAKITLNGYSATASGSTVTISPTSAYTPVITQSGSMILTVGPVCAWQADNTTCNWPVPGSNLIENIDDLWHAAVDGHGSYFSATSPSALSAGLSGALAAIASRKGSSAAAATSTLNPVAGNNFAYVASYTTVKWQGNLEARTINVSTGVISDAATWCVESIVAGTCSAPGVIVADTSGSSTIYNCVISGSTSATCAAPGVFDVATSECREQMATSCTGTMPGKVGASSDTRTIYTANSTGTALINFDAAYATANPTNFAAAHINTLSQWSSLTATQQTAAVSTNLINFLRGQTGYEDRAINLVGAVDNRLYRYREATLGDALESQPVFISKPVFSYADPGYSEFAIAQSARPGTVYMGTNDGMLHAFLANTEGSVPGGTERWAYVPSLVIPNMWKLADKDYATKHTNFVNGSPIISDICTANCTDSATAVWRTILVGGLNAGGRGYYALDITIPASPTLLWEFTTASDSDIGYSYGNPVITAKSDGTWVVLLTSGYNNTSPGTTGRGYLYVLNAHTGTVISKIGTGVGSTTTPSGLGKISAWSDAPASNRATYVYGGDLLGNVWRFDINTAGTPLLFATLLDPSGNPQPITTAPVLGKIGGKRIIFIGTGKYLETSDLSNTQVQSLYAIKDDNATVTLSNPAGSPRNSTTLVQQTLTLGNGVRTASSNAVDFNTGRGWYVDFPDSGERSNIESRLVQGTLLVATIVPSNTVCSPGGYGWLNFFDYLTGGPIDSSNIVSAKYDNTIVGINVLYINGAPVIETVTSNNPTPTVNNDVLIHGTPSGFTGKRVLWRELNP